MKTIEFPEFVEPRKSEVLILYLLYNQGPLHMGGIANALAPRMERSPVYYAIDRLEKKGWIYWSHTPIDRRDKKVYDLCNYERVRMFLNSVIDYRPRAISA